jgi:signal transduction histidine kinase
LIIAIPLITAYTVYYAGGYEVIIEKTLFSPTYSINDTYTLIALFILSIFSSFNPIILQRLLMSSNLKNAGKAFKLSAFVNVPFAFIIALMAGGAYVLNDSNLPSKYATLYAIGRTLPVGLKGFVIAGLLAIMMSTIDSFINTASILFTRDMYGSFKKNVVSSKSGLHIAQVTSVVIGITAYIISMFFEHIFDVYLFSLVFWVPVILMPLYGAVFKYYTSRFIFALAGLCGLLTFFISTQFVTIQPVSLICASIVSAVIFYHRGLLKLILHLPTHFSNVLQKIYESLKNAFQNLSLQNNPRFLFRQLPEVQTGFAAAVFICFFSAYFVSFGTNILVNLIRLLATVLGLGYLLHMFYPIRFQQTLIRNACFFYFYCGIFSPILLYLFEPSQGALIITVLFFLSTSLILSAKEFLLSLFVTLGFAMLFSSNVAHEKISFFIPATLAFFFAGSFGVLARYGIQKRFNTLNALASGIAHELRTPLASIHLTTLNAKKCLKAKKIQETEVFLDQIQKTLHNTSETINLSLYGLQMGIINAPLESLKLRKTILHLIKLYPFSEKEKSLFKTNINIPDSLEVTGNLLLLKAIIHNLIKNSLESIAEKGISKSSEVSLSLFKRQGNQVEINVYDTGVGIPYALTTKVFDEQVTTKENGNGIGLSFSYNAAQYMYGDLYCYSEPGQWTEFILRLPISDQKGTGNDLLSNHSSTRR